MLQHANLMLSFIMGLPGSGYHYPFRNNETNIYEDYRVSRSDVAQVRRGPLTRRVLVCTMYTRWRMRLKLPTRHQLRQRITFQPLHTLTTIVLHNTLTQPLRLISALGTTGTKWGTWHTWDDKTMDFPISLKLRLGGPVRLRN